jgi:hypothetical protein
MCFGYSILTQGESAYCSCCCADCLNVTCVLCENGKSISKIDSTQPTMAHDADTDSDPARPPDSKHPSARNATPALLLRTATRRRNAGHVVAHRRSGPAEERAQLVEGRSRRTGGGSGPTTSIRNAGGAFTNRMTAETLGVRADIACVLHMHMGRYDHPEVVLTLFRSIRFQRCR